MNTWAVIRFAGIIEPSITYRPSYPYTRLRPSMTPSSGDEPMLAPPSRCAVVGTFSTTSLIELEGNPAVRRAMSRAASLATGMYVGIGGCVGSCSLVMRRPNGQ